MKYQCSIQYAADEDTSVHKLGEKMSDTKLESEMCICHTPPSPWSLPASELATAASSSYSYCDVL